MHGADTRAHDRAADQQALPRQHAAGDDVEGVARGGDRHEHRGERGPRLVTHRNGELVGEHGDEVHRPDAGAHGEGAPGEPARGTPRLHAVLAHPAGEVDGGIGREGGDDVGKNDEAGVVRRREHRTRQGPGNELEQSAHERRLSGIGGGR